MKNILFVCRWNRFRSKIAEAYFNKICNNKEIRAKSAGLIKGWTPFDKYQVEEAKKLGIDLKGKTQGLTTGLMKWQDLIILPGRDIPKSVFLDKVPITVLNNKKIKVIRWDTPDVKFGDRKACRNTIKIIMRKVDQLNKKLRK